MYNMQLNLSVLKTLSPMWRIRQLTINISMMAICHLHNMHSQKLINNCPAVKKSVQPLLWKTMWNLRWQPRNGCCYRIMAKILKTIIQVNLLLVKHGEANTNLPELSLLKKFCHNLTITVISWPLSWILHLFSQQGW